MKKIYSSFILILMCLFIFPKHLSAQTFTSGPIPMCDTVTFTSVVSGVGINYPANWSNPMYAYFQTLTYLKINITSNHPQTLKITVTSPLGTTLLLSAFNGTSGSNYTNTFFVKTITPNITTGNAPFTGNWLPQGGSLSIFDYENIDGIWTITVIDTACTGGGGGGGGPIWTNGFFNGGSGAAGSGFGFSTITPPPCNVPLGQSTATICQGETFDLYNYFYQGYASYNLYFNGSQVANPSAISVNGTYYMSGSYAYPNSWCSYYGSFTLYTDSTIFLGPDQTVNLSCDGSPYDLKSLFNLNSLTPSWSFNGTSFHDSLANAVLDTGLYQLIIQNANGCRDTAIITLGAPLGFNIGVDQTSSICSGTSLDLTSLYNTSGLTSIWNYNGSPVTNPSSVNAGGTYSLFTSSLNGCSDTAEVTLTILPSPSLGSDQIINTCTSVGIDLTTLYNTSGYTSSWTYGGVPTMSPTSISSSGTYMLVASSASLCTDTALVTLTIAANPTLGPDVSTITCDGVNVNLTNLFNPGSNSASWYWSGNPISSPTSTSTAGTYSLIVTSSAGCSDTAEINLLVNPSPTLGNDLTINSCTNNGIDLTSLYNTTGLTSVWATNGSAVPNPSNVTNSGTYQLIATNGFSCSDTSQVILNLSPLLTLGTDVSISICSGDSVDITSFFNTTGNIPSWYYSGNSISPPSSVSTGGLYSLIATSSFGCTDTANVNLTVNPNPTLGLDQSHTICNNTSINLNSLYNMGGNTSSWLNGTLIVNNPSQVFNAGNYILVVYNSYGCKDSATVQVNHLTAPALGADQNINLCLGDVLDLTSIYNTSGCSIAWTNSGSPVLNPNAVDLNGNYLLIVTDLNGCMDTANAQLTLLPLPNLGSDQVLSVCEGNEIDLNSLYATVGSTVNWTSNSAPVSNPSSITIAGLYQLLATNNVGCSDSASVQITLLPKPNLGVDQTISSCDGIPVNLSNLYALNGLTTSWSLSGNPISNAAAILTAGTYELIVSNASGCLDTSSVTVTINPLPILGPDANYALCPWQTLDLSQVYNVSTYTALYSYLGNPVINYTSVHDSGYYSVFVTDANGCTNQATVEVINVFCRCEADFEFTAKCIQDPLYFKLLADSIVLDAHWNFSTANTPDVNEENPTVQFKSVGKHLVTLFAELSCGMVEVSKWIEVKDCSDSCQIWIPNSFSPNDDGKNENFVFYSECQPEQFKAKIYDRFGKLIYQSTNIVENWDGKIDGEYTTSGIFVYRIECKMPYKDEEILTGKITIIR